MLGFGISIPGLSDMAIGGEQTVGDQKACAGNSRPYGGPLIRKADLIDAVNVSDGVAVVSEDRGGHGLVLLELRYFGGKLVDFFLQIVRWRALGRCRRVVVDH